MVARARVLVSLRRIEMDRGGMDASHEADLRCVDGAATSPETGV